MGCFGEHDTRLLSPALCPLQASGFGPLKEGFLTSVNTHFSRTLLSRPPCPVLEALAKHIQYEVAVGLNGRVWVDADSPTKIILVANAISNGEFLSPAQTESLVAKLVEVSVTDLLWEVKSSLSPGGGLGGLVWPQGSLTVAVSAALVPVSAALECARPLNACLPRVDCCHAEPANQLTVILACLATGLRAAG